MMAQMADSTESAEKSGSGLKSGGGGGGVSADALDVDDNDGRRAASDGEGWYE